MVMMSALGFLPRLYQGTAYPACEVIAAQNRLLVEDPKILSTGPHRKDKYG